MAFEDKEVGGKSEFNDSIGLIKRLNDWWCEVDLKSYYLDVSGWFGALNIVYRELSTEISKEEQSGWADRRIKLNEMVQLQNIANLKSQKREINANLYFELDKMDIDLRKIGDNAGLNIKRADDPRNALK